MKRLRELRESFTTPPEHIDKAIRRPRSQPKFVDLFCGIGGASTGALNAGFEVVLAVDSCPLQLDIHRRNHPSTDHLCISLPCTLLPLPGSGEHWHLHGSPPCTELSQANRVSMTDEKREHGLSMVRWYLDFALASSATTWTLEQVGTRPVVALLESYLAQNSPHRTRLAYRVFNCSKFGVPQKRKRLIAGSPEIIARLEKIAPWSQTIADVIKHPRGTHVRNQCANLRSKFTPEGEKYYIKAGPDDLCAPITGPAHTVLAFGPLRWATPRTNTPLVTLNVEESARLQTFPEGYLLHPVRTHANRGVGNALPPLLMEQALADGRISPSLRWRPPATAV